MMRFGFLAALIATTSWFCGVACAQTAPKLTLQSFTPMPNIKPGDFDQFVADKESNKLFLSGEDFALMAVFNLKTGELEKTGGAVASPHKVILDKVSKHLFIADGHENSVKVLDENLNFIANIPVGEKPDAGVYDGKKRLFYVGSKVQDHGVVTSTISVISTATMTVLRTIPIPASTLKGMILDHKTNRIFLSMRDKNQVAVVNLADDSVRYWSAEGVHKNVPLALDSENHQLFVGSRNPGSLEVLDSQDGHLKQTLLSTETSDSMFYDKKAHILFVSGDDGLSTYSVAKGGNVTLLGTDVDVAGKTSLLVHDLNKIYVARPNKNGTIAGLEVYNIAY